MVAIPMLTAGAVVLSYNRASGFGIRLGEPDGDFRVLNFDMARGRLRILLETYAWGPALKAQSGQRFTARWSPIPPGARSVFADWPSWWLDSQQSDKGDITQRSSTVAGIVVKRARAEAPAGRTGFIPYAEENGIAFPVAYLAVLSVPFAIVAWRLHRQNRRVARVLAGLCPTCGYDCRATPGRCPECGTSSLSASEVAI